MTVWSYAVHSPSRSDDLFSAALTAEIRAGPTDYPSISEIGITFLCVSGQTSRIALIQNVTRGVLPVYSYPVLANEDAGNTNSLPGVNVAIYWQTAPVVAANRLRLEIVTGSNNYVPPVIWKFPRGLKLNPSTSLSLAYLSAGNNAWASEIYLDMS